ncbi:unnamed protein product [Acidithrix sp. C25]|nr:unnamed protein product [Acidithrix sp. C25]
MLVFRHGPIGLGSTSKVEAVIPKSRGSAISTAIFGATMSL